MRTIMQILISGQSKSPNRLRYWQVCCLLALATFSPKAWANPDLGQALDTSNLNWISGGAGSKMGSRPHLSFPFSKSAHCDNYDNRNQTGPVEVQKIVGYELLSVDGLFNCISAVRCKGP